MRAILRTLDHAAAYGIWFYKDLGNHNGKVANPIELTFTEVPEAFMLPEPTITIPFQYSQELLQSLVNALIKEGIRPDSDRTAGELEATKKHLQDLQKQLSNAMQLLEISITQGNK